MNFRQTELIADFEEKLKTSFPDIALGGHYEKDDGSVVVRALTPTDNEFEIAEAMSHITVDILDRYGYLIFVSPAWRNGETDMVQGTRDGARVTETA